MIEVTLDVTLTLTGPVFSGASAAGAFGLDLPFARYADHFYLPGAQVKGRLREALKILVPYLSGFDANDLNAWFGPEIPLDLDNFDLPKRGKIVFDDFVASAPGGDGTQIRISMDNQRGAVKKGQYVVIESPFSPGEEIEFRGALHFFCDDPDRSRMKETLEAGLRWIPSLGGQKSVGFGLISAEDIKESEKDVPKTVDMFDPCDALDLKIYINAPFCVAKPRMDENLFRSESIISGAVLKGTAANTLNQMVGRNLGRQIDDTLLAPWKEIGANFSKIRFSHAFPTPEGQDIRPQHYPLSIVRAKGETYDAALCSGPALISGEAPMFSIDWKSFDYNAVEQELCGVFSPPTTLRVRTAIDEETRRAEEKKLFAYEMIDPRHCVWHSRVDLTEIPESVRGKVRSQLETLLDFGLRYLGKTKADAEVKTSQAQPFKVPDLIDGKYWIVTLQTPALVLEPVQDLNRAFVDETILLKKYHAFWQAISGNTLKLTRFFAQQKLLGGYLHYRYQNGKPYNPFLVTMERSVFVLVPEDGKEAEAEAFLGKAISRGLPLPEWAKEMYGADWNTCPFIPENGYGEIAVNMACHKSKAIPNEILEEI